MNHICDYGCGREAKYQFKNGQWCCESHYSQCPIIRKKNSERHKKFIPSIESRRRMSESHKGKFIGKNNPFFGKHHTEKTRKKLSYSLEDWKEKHPFLFEVEELKEDSKTGKIQGHCKNHNCPNSKEMDGWFILFGSQLYDRAICLERGNGGSYFYCSEECKKSCILFGKSTEQIMKQDLINSGHITEELGSEGSEIFRHEVFKRNIEEYGKLQCEICGNINKDELSVHHEMPQKTHPEMSLDPINGWVLCSFGKGNNCHLKYGHQGDCSPGALAKLVCEKKYRKEKK